MEAKEYVVTDKAGNFVAGIRNPGAGKKTPPLTPEQAAYALGVGQLTDPDAPVEADPKPAKKAKPDAPEA